MPRLTLPDGRWLDARLPTTDQFLALLDPDEDPDAPLAGVRRIRVARDALRDAFIETSWGGVPGDLRPDELAGLVGPWLAATEDDALPLASGTSSGTTLPEPDFAETERSGSPRS